MTQLREPDTTMGLWRFSVEQYHQLVRSGVLDEDTPVELLEGWLVEKMSKNPPHTLATNLVRRFLEQAGFEGVFVNVQEPITLSTSEPEPDLSVIHGTERDYATRHPCAADVALVVEVAASSLERDQTWKRRVYAQDGIARYWILNLQARVLEVYEQPVDGQYPQPRVYGELETVELSLNHRVARVLVQALLP